MQKHIIITAPIIPQLVAPMEPEILSAYGNRLRVRACGICRQGDALLLVNHAGLGKESFWAPPGGEVLFGYSLAETVEREFLEETGLVVVCGDFRFAGEFIDPPLHAVELFFETRITGGSLRIGHDPEVNFPTIRQARFFTAGEISRLAAHQKHGLFRYCHGADDLNKLTGFYRF